MTTSVASVFSSPPRIGPGVGGVAGRVDHVGSVSGCMGGNGALCRPYVNASMNSTARNNASPAHTRLKRTPHTQ